jgi:cytochrome c peroxidase
MMLMRVVVSGALALGFSLPAQAAQPPAPVFEVVLSEKQALGKRVFFDPRLSNPTGMSCASCHQPGNGFADPDSQLPVSEGTVKGRFTSRNAPSIAYAAFSPAFHFDQEEGIFFGGQFYDGRASSLEEQASGPLFSEVEMNAGSEAEVVAKLRNADYAPLFDKVYGEGALAEPGKAFTHIIDALAAYERSGEVSPFSSKYDYYLAGKAELTAQELRGLKVFEAEDKGNCAACHPSARDEQGNPPLFTDFSYDNLGLPRNPASPYLKLSKRFNPEGEGFVDRGLGNTVGDANEDGKFKVPTLRNIALSAPYMHNGIFDTLEESVDFYNTRDVDDKWGAPEVTKNVNKDELGDLKLSEQEVADLVSFLKTLTDGYRP